MKVYSFLVAVLFVLILNGCNNAQPKPTYNKDYSSQKILIRDIFVKDKYQAEDIIRQLNNSNNKLEKFIDLQQSKSIVVDNQPEKRIRYYWTDSSRVIPQFGNKIFELKEGSYLQEPLFTNWGWNIVYLEKRISKQEFSQLQAREQEKQKKRQAQREKINLDRIASYEINYIDKHSSFLKNKPEYKVAFVQPSNKEEPCKIYMGYSDGDEYFKEDSWKVYWDGNCKNGFATGLGREIEKADMTDKWQIGIYKKGKAKGYIIQKDILNDMLIEGLDNDDISFLVVTDIKVKQNDIDVTTIAGERNSKTGINLLASNSPFWNGSYMYAKEYMGFRYMYINNQANDSTNLEFDFFMENPKNGKNGWAFSKYRDKALVSGEWVNNKASHLNLPKKYNDKADAIIKEVSAAQQKAYQAQQKAQKVKKQYLKRICKDKVKINFMDNDEYKEICNSKNDSVIFAKINEKMKKITDAKNAKLKQESEAKIAKLAQERYTAQQQKEERQRQELLSLERQKIAEIERANRATEKARSSAQFQQGLKNLTDQINNMTPKTYNVNMYHY
jgi:hypothetical protein